MSAPHGMGPPRPSKYRSAHCWWCVPCDVPVDALKATFVKCSFCGAGPRSPTIIHFDSKRERTRWHELRLMQRAGKIKDLRRQVSFPIRINGKKVGAYRCDFHYLDEGHEFYTIEDVKGIDTPLSKFKRKCVAAQTGTEVRIVR